MRKLIEISQENLVECDNPKCDYVIKNLTGDPGADTTQIINRPCPKCGDNLLTQEDHDLGVKMVKTVGFINRWFSWLTIFLPKPKKEDVTYIQSHKGLKITKEK